jgi:hypothetical protein
MSLPVTGFRGKRKGSRRPNVDPASAPDAVGLAAGALGMLAASWLSEVVLFPCNLLLLFRIFHHNVVILACLCWHWSHLSDSRGRRLFHDNSLHLALVVLLVNNLGRTNRRADLLEPAPRGRRTSDLGEAAADAGLLVCVVDVDAAHVEASLGLVAVRIVAGGELLHVGEALAVVMVVGAQVVLVVELARVAFVADGAVEEAHRVGDGVVALRGLGGVCGAG